MQAAGSQVVSQTSKVTIYHIPAKYIKNQINGDATPCCINIIDTPGFGDTRPGMDKNIRTMIRACFDVLKTLDYILVVAKSDGNQFTQAQKEVFGEVTDVYKGANLHDRMLGIFTFNDGTNFNAAS